LYLTSSEIINILEKRSLLNSSGFTEKKVLSTESSRFKTPGRILILQQIVALKFYDAGMNLNVELLNIGLQFGFGWVRTQL
jgi:hypothetical protein